MAAYAIPFLRISLGVVFLWFGVLKFFAGASPAEALAGKTIATLTFGMMQPEVSLPILAVWESLIGLGLLSGKFVRTTLLLLFLQMPGTMLPLFFFPHECFTQIPYAPTLEGQYIIKNLVLVAGAIAVGAMARGGDVVADADLAAQQRERLGK